MPCYWGHLLWSIRLCPFWGRKSPFVPMAMHNFTSWAMSFRTTCWIFTIILLISFHLSIPVQCQLQKLSQLQHCQAPLWYPLLSVIITANTMPHHWAFHFQGSGLPVVEPGLALCAKCILPSKNSRLLSSFCISWPLGCLVRWLPYIWRTVLLKLIYVIKVAQHLFFSRLACHILNLANEQGIVLIAAYIPTYAKVEAISLGRLILEWCLLPHIA